jgi:hypothetical protein
MTTSPAATADDVDPSEAHGVIPPDRFGTRIAIVRADLGFNYDRLSDACRRHGTPIHSEQFRRWEFRMAQCADPVRVARVLARIPIPGTEHLPPDQQHFDWRWIAYGGPMPPEQIAHPPGPEQEVLTNWREASRVIGRVA